MYNRYYPYLYNRSVPPSSPAPIPPKPPKKKFDLCEKCYRAFIKAMEKGVKNGKNDNVG